MTTYKLIGSAGSLEELHALIEKKWGWRGFTFEPHSEANRWEVRIKGEVDQELRVIHKGKRYRFERAVEGGAL